MEAVRRGGPFGEIHEPVARKPPHDGHRWRPACRHLARLRQRCARGRCQRVHPLQVSRQVSGELGEVRARQGVQGCPCGVQRVVQGLVVPYASVADRRSRRAACAARRAHKVCLREHGAPPRQAVQRRPRGVGQAPAQLRLLPLPSELLGLREGGPLHASRHGEPVVRALTGGRRDVGAADAGASPGRAPPGSAGGQPELGGLPELPLHRRGRRLRDHLRAHAQRECRRRPQGRLLPGRRCGGRHGAPGAGLLPDVGVSQHTHHRRRRRGAHTVVDSRQRDGADVAEA
mmetsp:Transcript_92416/g.258268  ORF Transcript_92416/g.258268 Transcript_92416/m.258268 type:complete len:288 (-) Transcript_92416:181-1044(-)